MAVSPDPPARFPAGYAFDEFLVDPVRRLIWRNNRVLMLGGKTFDLLLVLLRYRDRILGKDELLSLIWPDAIVQENNLVRQMSNLRRALDQRPDQHDIVVTVSGRGYRFVADVTELDKLPADLPHSIEGAPNGTNGSKNGRNHAETNGHASPDGSIASDQAAPPPSAPAHRRTGLVTVITAAAAVVALIAIALYGLQPKSVIGAPRTLSQLTYDAGLSQQATWAPDGQRLAYAADVGGNSDIWIQSTDDPTPRRITTSAGADWQPDWAPDGTRLAFRSEREARGIYVVSVNGGDERRVSDFGFRPRWSPDGTRVLIDDMDAEGPKRSPYVVPATGGNPRRVRPDVAETMRLATTGWHPDGRVSFLNRSNNGWMFVTAPVDAGVPVRSRIPTEIVAKLDGVDLGRFVWARSGAFIFVEGRFRETSNVWRIAVDPATLAWKSAEQITTAAGHDGDLTLTPDGRRLAFTSLSQTTRLWSFSYDVKTGHITGDGTPITSGGAGEFDAAVPPDGSKLAYRTQRINRQELWQHSIADGRDQLLLTSETERITSPRWSADGARLVYARRLGDTGPTRSPFLAIFNVADGRETRFPLTPSERLVPDDWSPDGRLVLGACSVEDLKRLGVCVTASTPTTPVVELKLLASDPDHDLICQRFSPDQRWISFLAVDGNRSRLSTIYVMPATGGAWIPITTGSAYDDKPRWSGDGRMIFFLSDREGLVNLWARRFDPVAGRPTGEPFRVTSFDSARRRLPVVLRQIEIAVSNDRVFLPITESTGKIWILDHVDR